MRGSALFSFQLLLLCDDASGYQNSVNAYCSHLSKGMTNDVLLKKFLGTSKNASFMNVVLFGREF